MMALANKLLQRRAIDILHQQEVLPPLFNKIKNGDGIGVSKRSSGTGFAAEAFNSAKIVLIEGAQDFNGDYTLNAVIPGFIDTGHTTCRDMLADLVSSCNRRFAFKMIQPVTSNNLGICERFSL